MRPGSEPAPRTEFDFELCGVRLRLDEANASNCDRLHALWTRAFCAQPMAPGRPAPSVSFFLGSTPRPFQLPDSAREISRSRSLTIWKTDVGFVLKCDASHLELELASNEARGSIDTGFWQQPFAEQREFFLLGFLMLLGGHGLFGLHGNAVVHDGRGYLIVAGSGCGKTTLALTLISQEFRYLSDDAFCLSLDGSGGVEARALRSGFSCTEETTVAFPHLDRGNKEALGSVKDKWLVDGESVFPGQFVPRCRPQVILLPRITTEPESRLLPVAPADALIELIRQSPGVLTDRDRVTQQMDRLRLLLRQCTAHTIQLGADVFDQPARVAEMIVAAGVA